MNETILYFTTLPLLELIAVVTALLYVVLAAKANIWCWPAALISTLLFTVIFYEVYLWMDSLLQIYYMVMAVYGWYSWRNSRKLSFQNTQVIEITRWPVNKHIKIIVLLGCISIVLGWLMSNYTVAHFPYFDSATTVFAVFTTYLVVIKVLENWLYWIVIDLVSIYLYIEKDLTPTAVLFGLYVVLAIYGYFQWRKMHGLAVTSNEISKSAITN
ncbi:MAG: nicotinamide mononucleotide transporter [Alteromonadaceae bacterium]|nr:nicotinamide mononucleotide transporter [Alteromonadaceae bacterium]